MGDAVAGVHAADDAIISAGDPSAAPAGPTQAYLLPFAAAPAATAVIAVGHDIDTSHTAADLAASTGEGPIATVAVVGGATGHLAVSSATLQAFAAGRQTVATTGAIHTRFAHAAAHPTAATVDDRVQVGTAQAAATRTATLTTRTHHIATATHTANTAIDTGVATSTTVIGVVQGVDAHAGSARAHEEIRTAGAARVDAAPALATAPITGTTVISVAADIRAAALVIPTGVPGRAAHTGTGHTMLFLVTSHPTDATVVAVVQKVHGHLDVALDVEATRVGLHAQPPVAADLRTLTHLTQAALGLLYALIAAAHFTIATADIVATDDTFAASLTGAGRHHHFVALDTEAKARLTDVALGTRPIGVTALQRRVVEGAARAQRQHTQA